MFLKGTMIGIDTMIAEIVTETEIEPPAAAKKA